jgi:SAM-dependent methyltransferase
MSARPAGHPVPCNLCGGDDAELQAVQRGFRVVRCRRCGLVYVNPRPATEALPACYAAYHARGGKDEASWERLMARVFREAANVFDSSRNGNGPGRILDVGCGFGGFTALMRRRGWDAEGIDPSPAAVESANLRNVPVRLARFEELKPGGRPYDGIALFYVLEHLPDPMGALQRAFALLAPEGTLLLRVPHTAPIVRMLSPFGLGGELFDPPFHLYDFSPPVLRRMLSAAGFASIRTFPGEPTVPHEWGARLAAATFGAAARILHAASGSVLLLPGVSKTTIAKKPPDRTVDG